MIISMCFTEMDNSFFFFFFFFFNRFNIYIFFETPFFTFQSGKCYGLSRTKSNSPKLEKLEISRKRSSGSSTWTWRSDKSKCQRNQTIFKHLTNFSFRGPPASHGTFLISLWNWQKENHFKSVNFRNLKKKKFSSDSYFTFHSKNPIINLCFNQKLYIYILLNKSWRQHPTKHQLYGHLLPITKTIQVRRARHAGHCWSSRDELISDVILWNPTNGRAKAG